MADDENTAVDELIRRTTEVGQRQAAARTEVSLRPRAITTTMPLPMEPLRRRPRATPPIPTKTQVRALITTDMVPALPPYVPAPDVGDPGEADATVPVEQYDFTELVDRHRVYLDPEPAKKSPLRFLPVVGIAGLAAVFLGGYLMFDAETRAPKPQHHTIVATAAPAQPAAVAPAQPAPVAAVEPTAVTEPTMTHEPRETPKVPALYIAPTTDEAPAPATAPAVVEAPKPRTAVFVTSNRKVQIFVDGKSANATAPKKLYLSPGSHKITLWDTVSGKTESIQVMASEGKVTRLDKQFK